MRLEIAIDSSYNVHQSDDLGDWSNIDAIHGEQEWNSESEEEHGGDVGHDGVFFGAGGVTLAEEENIGDACSA